MDAVILNKLGEAPQFGRFEEPVAAAGEELVTVAAASVKQLDRAIARGTHYASPKRLPVVCGTDGIGYLGDGTRVYFMAMRPPFGGMAERSVTSLYVPVPEGVDDATAAALVNPALGAWLPLEWRAKLAPGESVVVLGATGATGKLAVKCARILGAGRVVAAGRNMAELEKTGADAYIDTKLPHDELVRALRAAAGPKGFFDVAVDYLWGPPAEALIATLGEHGLGVAEAGSERGVRLVSVGAMAGATVSLPSSVLRSSHLHILGSGTGNFPPPEIMKPTIGRILAEAANGALTVDTETMDMRTFAARWDETAKSPRRPVMVVG